MDARRKAQVDAAIANVIGAGVRLAEAKMAEMELDSARPQVKSDAIGRLMSLENPQKPGSNYSATAAAEVVMYDLEFADFEKRRRTATAATIRLAGEYEAAKLAARFAVSDAEVESFEPLRLALNDAHAMVLK